jgi:hypothetical protein
MSTLSTELRNKLERTCIVARNLAEQAAKDALQSLAVAHHEAYGHMAPEQRTLRNKLRARARQLGDTQDAKGQLSIEHIAQECGYEHWHRMLFARFLAENNLLIEPEMGVAVSLEEVKELAKEAKTDLWEMAGRYAQTMLPEIFRADDPVLQVSLAREDQLKLEELLDALAKDTFTASDSLGWCYQFWQAQRKKEVNDSEVKIGADELPSVTQLFTEDYMVDFLLDNTLGAWWAGKKLTAENAKNAEFKSEEEARRFCALPGCPWKYLRFIRTDAANVSPSPPSEGGEGRGEVGDSQLSTLNSQLLWRPAAGTFDGWPKTAKELKCLDPCMGSGHFVVAMFERLVALRMAEEGLREEVAVERVIRENLYGLEIDPRCTQIAAFNLAMAAWRRVGYCKLPPMHLACSGLAPNTREADWLALAGDDGTVQNSMARLYRLFKNAPVLGSLINPRAAQDELLEAAFHKLQPLLEKALAQETKDDTVHEMAVTARGLAKAAEILAGQFTLVATNVPYLGRGKQDEVLMDYCQRVHPEAKADLATCFVERSHEFCGSCGSVALVTPQNLLSQLGYKSFRNSLLKTKAWNCVARLGPGAFETISGEVVNVALYCASSKTPPRVQTFLGIDVTEKQLITKRHELIFGQLLSVNQTAQLQNPDVRIIFDAQIGVEPLSKIAISVEGLSTGDSERFLRMFWELPWTPNEWDFFQRSPDAGDLYGGARSVLRWEQGNGPLANSSEARIQGNGAWQRRGVVVNMMNDLNTCLSVGAKHDKITAVIVPKKESDLLAIWTFCSNNKFCAEVRKLNAALQPGTGTLVKIPFDLAHWQQVAAEKYPHGLPKPFSSDPTQWLFNGHPKRSDQPLQVAMARLLGYLWPRQTGSSFPDCPALGPDGLEKLADDDGIVCIPSVRGKELAAERLRKLMAAAYGADWKPETELALIRATGSTANDLDEWLRNDFFQQHCEIFHHRPFIWHVWDGRKRDGFHALVNYHKLAGIIDDGSSARLKEDFVHPGQKVLASLTHSYIGEWISRQKDGMKRGEEGAEERLAAAEALKERLEAIFVGEPPFDIFVRWKPLHHQAIGWKPDINDGVRMNIRPFLASDIPGGKKGAGILRTKPNIKWEKDRGKEPMRDKADYPWFWNGGEFTGDRVNEVHLTKEQKEKARK